MFSWDGGNRACGRRLSHICYRPGLRGDGLMHGLEIVELASVLIEILLPSRK